MAEVRKISKNVELYEYPDSEEALEGAAFELDKVIREDVPVLILFSGGSALGILDKVVLKDSSNLTISVLDERYSLDPDVNNFSQFKKSDFYARTKINGASFIDTRIKEENESMQELAKRFQKEIGSWIEKNSNGIIIVTQGIGSDGHTAGIMPYPEDENKFNELFDAGDYVVHYNAGEEKSEYPLRITTTLPFLRNVDHSIIFISGKEKMEALKNILAENGRLNEFPGRIVKEMKDVKIFTDINIG